MAEFVCDSEGESEAGVFVDAAAAMGLTHPGHLRQTQGTAWLVHARTNVLSENISCMFLYTIRPPNPLVSPLTHWSVHLTTGHYM